MRYLLLHSTRRGRVKENFDDTFPLLLPPLLLCFTQKIFSTFSGENGNRKEDTSSITNTPSYATLTWKREALENKESKSKDTTYLESSLQREEEEEIEAPSSHRKE